MLRLLNSNVQTKSTNVICCKDDLYCKLKCFSFFFFMVIVGTCKRESSHVFLDLYDISRLQSRVCRFLEWCIKEPAYLKIFSERKFPGKFESRNFTINIFICLRFNLENIKTFIYVI